MEKEQLRETRIGSGMDDEEGGGQEERVEKKQLRKTRVGSGIVNKEDGGKEERV